MSENDTEKDSKTALVSAMLADFELTNIAVMEFSSKAIIGDHEAPTDEPDDTAQIEFSLRSKQDECRLEYRLSARAIAPQSESFADVIAVYTSKKNYDELPEDVLVSFGNKVAFMNLYPYVREMIQSSSSRVSGGPVLLPLMVSGSVVFTESGIES